MRSCEKPFVHFTAGVANINTNTNNLAGPRCLCSAAPSSHPANNQMPEICQNVFSSEMILLKIQTEPFLSGLSILKSSSFDIIKEESYFSLSSLSNTKPGQNTTAHQILHPGEASLELAAKFRTCRKVVAAQERQKIPKLSFMPLHCLAPGRQTLQALNWQKPAIL